MAYVQRWEGEWDEAEVPLARLSCAWTDPATMREWIAVMQARGGYCETRPTTLSEDGRELFWLCVTVPRTGPIVTVDAYGHEEMWPASPPHPNGPDTITLDFSWSVGSHSYPTPPDRQEKLAAYAARHPERIEERNG